MKRKIIYLTILLISGIAFFFLYHRQSSGQPNRPKESSYLALREIDLNRAYDYGLSDDRKTVNEEYIKLQNFYRNLVCDYINQHIDFTDFDQEISQLEASKYFKLVQKPLKQVDSREDYFSSVSSLDSQYLYLRNQIFIERLSKDEFQILKDIRKGKIENQDDKNTLIKDTIVKVLSYYKNEKDRVGVQYRYHGGGNIKSDILHTSILFSIENREPSNFEEIPYFSDAQTPKRREELLKYDSLVPKYEEIFSKELGVTVQIENSLYSGIRQT